MDIVLSYHDALLRSSDFRILNQKNEWINDNLVEFWFEYLAHEMFAEHRDRFAFLSPSVSQLIKLDDDATLLESILTSLGITREKYIFVALNDNLYLDEAGGSHWTLLVFNPQTLTFEHYDSSNGSLRVEKQAKNLASKLTRFIIKDQDFEPRFKPVRCLQQQDSSSCGIHLMANAESLARKFASNDATNIEALVTNDVIRGFKQRIADIITRLRQETGSPN